MTLIIAVLGKHRPPVERKRSFNVSLCVGVGGSLGGWVERAAKAKARCGQSSGTGAVACPSLFHPHSGARPRREAQVSAASRASPALAALAAAPAPRCGPPRVLR